MRTTINLDDDVLAAVERLRREEGVSLSEAVNRFARAGLAQRRSERRFRQRTTSLEFTVDPRNVGEVLDLLDEAP